MTSWCPIALPVTVELRLAARTSFSSSFVEVLGGHFSSKQELAAHGRVRAFRLLAEDAAGAVRTAVAQLQDPRDGDLELAVTYPPRIDLPTANAGAFVRRLTMVLESAWPGEQAGACIGEIAVHAIPWSANPESDVDVGETGKRSPSYPGGATAPRPIE